jgi:hypothetical protein
MWTDGTVEKTYNNKKIRAWEWANSLKLGKNEIEVFGMPT